MKERIIICLFAFLSTANLLGQQGKIIYKDYGPDGLSHEFIAWPSPNYDDDDPQIALEIDFDLNGTTDLYYQGMWTWTYTPYVTWSGLVSTYSDRFWFCEFYKGYDTIYNPLGDTISIIQEGQSYPSSNWSPERHHSFQHGWWEGDIDRPNSPYIAFRVPKDEGYCYGWIEHSIEYIKYPCDWCGDYTYYHNSKVTIYRWAYCTIPNYPLCVGQTSFDWDVAENEANYFAAIHPNPTTGLVTITGKDLKQAEVFNALGQHVATAQCEGERLTVDISALPAGIYFVNVTDEDGKKCIRKVVKQ